MAIASAEFHKKTLDVLLSPSQQEVIFTLLKKRGVPCWDQEVYSVPTDEKKFLRNISAALEEIGRLGFTEQQAEMALRTCGTTKLDVLLDWLCIQLSNSELPPLFRGRLPNSKTVSSCSESEEGLQVIAPRSETSHPLSLAPPSLGGEVDKVVEPIRAELVEVANTALAEEEEEEDVVDEENIVAAAAAAAAAAATVAADEAVTRRAWILARQARVEEEEAAAKEAEANLLKGEENVIADEEEQGIDKIEDLPQRHAALEALLLEATASHEQLLSESKGKNGINWEGGVDVDRRGAESRQNVNLKSKSKWTSNSKKGGRGGTDCGGGGGKKKADAEKKQPKESAAAVAPVPVRFTKVELAHQKVLRLRGKVGASKGELRRFKRQEQEQKQSDTSTKAAAADTAAEDVGGLLAATTTNVREEGEMLTGTEENMEKQINEDVPGDEDEDNEVEGEVVDEPGLSLLWDGDEVASTAVATPASNSLSASSFTTYETGSSLRVARWSGKTPRQLLEAGCQRQGIAPPRFHKPQHPLGIDCTLTLSFAPTPTRKGSSGGKKGQNKPTHNPAGGDQQQLRQDLVLSVEDLLPLPADVVALEALTLSEGSARKRGKGVGGAHANPQSQAAFQSVAARALFELNRDKPMHHVLAPPYRDLWKTWVAVEAEAVSGAKAEAKAEKDTVLLRLAQDMKETVEANVAKWRLLHPYLHEQQQLQQQQAQRFLDQTAKEEETQKGGGSESSTQSQEPQEEPAVEVDSWEDLVDNDDDDDKSKPQQQEDAAVEIKSWEDLVDDAGNDKPVAVESWEDLVSNEDETSQPASHLGASQQHVPVVTAVETAATSVASNVEGSRLRDAWAAREASSEWQRMAEFRSTLPMAKHRAALLGAVGTIDSVVQAPQQQGSRGGSGGGGNVVSLSLGNCRVVVICGATGCGKTTQLGQFILEDAFSRGVGHMTNIVITQPRRVAATSVAERVAAEMAEPAAMFSSSKKGDRRSNSGDNDSFSTRVGGLVGYTIRGESRTTPITTRGGRDNTKKLGTRLLFCTVGVLLRRLHDDPTLEGVSHVVVDEVHERQAEGDFLVTALRELVSGPRRNTNFTVILMSATVDASLFQNYFGGPERCPLIQVEGRAFPVASYFLDDLLWATGHIIEDGSKYSTSATHHHYHRDAPESRDGQQEVLGGREGGGLASRKEAVRRSMERVDESVINYDLIENLLGVLCGDDPSRGGLFPPPLELESSGQPNRPKNAPLDNGMSGAPSLRGKTVLVFLPGLGEIRRLHERLASHRLFQGRGAGSGHWEEDGAYSPRRFLLMSLHSALSASEQRRVFEPTPSDSTKIVLATNIAETSVTIPGVVVVIDTGRVKEIRHARSRNGGSTKKGSAAIAASALTEDWCSRANSAQRQGRAGRTEPGIVCRLYSRETHEGRKQHSDDGGGGEWHGGGGMAAYATPELMRVPLENLCLEIKAAGLEPSGSCATFLAKAPEPPPPDAVEAALATLLDVGAIDLVQEEGRNSEEDGSGILGQKSLQGSGAAMSAKGSSKTTAWSKSDPYSLLRLLRKPAAATSKLASSSFSSSQSSDSWDSSSGGGGFSGSGGCGGEVGGDRVKAVWMVDDSKLALTPLGRHLAKLPVDVRLGKMLVLASLLGCLDPVATAVASISAKSPFASAVSSERRLEMETARRSLEVPQSDFFTAMACFDAMEDAGLRASSSDGFGADARAERWFCDRHFLSHSAMVEYRDLRKQIIELLKRTGLVGSSTAHSKTRDDESTDFLQDNGSKQGSEKGPEKLLEGDLPHHVEGSGTSGGKSSSQSVVPTYSGGDWRKQKQETPSVSAATSSKFNLGSATSSAAMMMGKKKLHPLGGAFANRHQSNRNLVAAVIAAGLYPNLAVAKPNIASSSKPLPTQLVTGNLTAASSLTSTSSSFTPSSGFLANSNLKAAAAAMLAAGALSSSLSLEWRCLQRGRRPPPSAIAAATITGHSAAAAGSTKGNSHARGASASSAMHAAAAPEEGEVVHVHRDSTNFGRAASTTRFLTFFEKRKSGQAGGGGGGKGHMQLMQTGCVSPFAVLMFMNNGELEVRHGEQAVLVDQCHRLAIAPKTAVLLKLLRAELNAVLKTAAESPASVVAATTASATTATATADSCFGIGVGVPSKSGEHMDGPPDLSHVQVLDAVAAIFSQEIIQAAPFPAPPPKPQRTLD